MLKLKQITLGDSITTIGHSAFKHCESLEQIIVPMEKKLHFKKILASEGVNEIIIGQWLMMSTTHMDSVKFLQHMHNQLSIIGEDISLKEEYYYCPICQKEVLKDNFKIVLSKEHVP